MADENKCGHSMCDCPVSGDAKYCSDHCKDAADQDIVEIACDCGHPGVRNSLNQLKKAGLIFEPGLLIIC